ncbi:MAG TPA: septal ring lytic transglycosylase RlpA family protein [Granulicella sp.]|jgi:rare lipoprotein A|nr:septal ring lytic transglycosylase RlpA family protein [Granulicella sp.]
MQIISLKTHGKRTLQIASRISASLLVLALGFPASASGPDQPASTNLRPVKRFKRWIQVGQASWYGLKFQGRKTATGESYDMNQLTCAHRSLPLGSWVRVTNLKNKRSVVVRVNDRGPAINNRIVDLSYAAAKAVGLAGIGKVRLDSMREGDPELTQALLAQVKMPLLSPVSLPLFGQ